MGIPWENHLNFRDQVVEHIDGGRIKGNNEGSREEADWIEKIEQLPCHEARGQGKEKNSVAEPPQGLLVEPLRPLLLSEKDPIKEIDSGSHRAEPPTEEIAKNGDEEKNSEGREHAKDELLLSEKSDNGDEGIESQIEINRNLQLEREGGPNDQVEEEQKRKGLGGPSESLNRSCHVALTLLTWTLARSI